MKELREAEMELFEKMYAIKHGTSTSSDSQCNLKKIERSYVKLLLQIKKTVKDGDY
jgi:hypothetical protein